MVNSEVPKHIIKLTIWTGHKEVKKLFEKEPDLVPDLYQYYKNAYNEFDRPAVKGNSYLSQE